MTLGRRVAGLAARAAEEASGCPGRGVMTALRGADDPGPEPAPCPVCGGRHVLVVTEVVVEAGPRDPGVDG